MNPSITLNDYEFIPPAGWQVSRMSDHIRIQNMKSGCLILLLAPQPVSGDLEKEAQNVFAVMYQGWSFQNKGEKQFDLSKGFLKEGLEFCMFEASMNKLSADGSRYEGFEEGAAMIVRYGTQSIYISVRHNSSMLDHQDCLDKYETCRRFFNSFTVKNGAIPSIDQSSFKDRIIGVWTIMTNGPALGEYVFAANGHYQLGASLASTSTTKDDRYEYLHIKSYSFEGDGSYSLLGDQLTLRKNGNSNEERMTIRFDQVNHGGTGWRDRLFMLKESEDGNHYEVIYEKKEN